MYDMTEYLETIDRVIEQGPFKDNWESLCAFEVPKWYRNAKFGIYSLGRVQRSGLRQ